MDKKEIIKSNNAPEAIGPYSQAVFIDGFLFISGQIPIDPELNFINPIPIDILKSDALHFENQVLQCLKNIEGIISEKNMDLNDIVKLTVFLTDISNFNNVNNAFEKFFNKGYYPARSLIEVSKLPKNSNIEIFQDDFRKIDFLKFDADCYFFNNPWRNEIEPFDFIVNMSQSFTKKSILIILANYSEKFCERLNEGLKNSQCIGRYYIKYNKGYHILKLNSEK